MDILESIVIRIFFFFLFFGHNDGSDIRSLFSLASIVFSRTKAKLIFWHASAAL